VELIPGFKTYHFPHCDFDWGAALLSLDTGVVATLLNVASGVELAIGIGLVTGSREQAGGLEHVCISANLGSHESINYPTQIYMSVQG